MPVIFAKRKCVLKMCTHRHGYGYASLLFFALYGEYLSKSHSIIDVVIIAPTMLNHTSTRNTVMNLNKDVWRTGFRMTVENITHTIKQHKVKQMTIVSFSYLSKCRSVRNTAQQNRSLLLVRLSFSSGPPQYQSPKSHCEI